MSSKSTNEEDHDLLERALIESLDKDERIPLDLYTASLIGDFATVSQLISSGIELDRKNKRGGWTPIMYAAYVGRDTIVNLLLESGADVNIGTTKMDTTALMLASDCGNESIVYFLLQQGALVNARDRKGQTALFHAVEGGHVNVVKLLLDHDADIEARQFVTLLTPLMVAAIEGHAVIFNMLLEYGADLNAKSQFKETAASLANSFGNITIVNIIENLYQEINTAQLRKEAGLFDNEIGVRDGPEKFERLAREARNSSNQKDSTVVRSRDMVSPIDAKDYEQVEGSLSQSDWMKLEKDFRDMTMVNRNDDGEAAATNQEGLKGEVSQTIVVPKRKGKISRICYELPKHQLWLESQGQDKHPTEKLSEVLDSLNLTKYNTCFENEDIDMETFLTLNDEELKQIGINKLGPRKKLISYIQNYAKSKSGDGKGGGNQPSPGENENAIQQAHAYVEYLQAQVHKEKQGRHELESYFVAERGRLDHVHKHSVQLKTTFHEILTLLDGFRRSCESTTGVLTPIYRDLLADKQVAKKNLDEALENQRQSLDTISKVASQISDCFKANEFIIGLCTKGHTAES